MAISFHKMHGLGNDFVILDARERAIEPGEGQRRLLCDRQRGVGCDQLIRIGPSQTADVRMDIWNADGSPAEACGNAARCVAALTGAQSIETPGGLLEAEGTQERVSVTLPPPRFDWNAIPLAYALDTSPLPMGWEGLERPDAVNVGNPHLVFLVRDVDAIQLGQVGPTIERDALFPERINVNVAQVEGDGLVLRTFERGAGLTQACGTGACATAVAAIRRGLVTSPVEVRMPGGALEISWSAGGAIVMSGPATHVFSGEIDLEGLA